MRTTDASVRLLVGVLLGFLSIVAVGTATAQRLLEGEFGDIDLGRELIEPMRFPTVNQLRKAVSDPKVSFVLMLKLHGNENNHHLPIWSWDGQRLALQRGEAGGNTSKLLLYNLLSQTDPELLTTDNAAYDYMFRWGINNPSSFVFSRIEAGKASTHVYYSPDGSAVELRTPGDGHYFYPSLYERTDGTHWLAYEHDGQLMQQAWRGEVREEQAVAMGTTPRWSRSGRSLLMARQSTLGGLASFEMVVRDMSDRSEHVVPSSDNSLVRSPEWGPDDQRIAYYLRGPRENAAWEIQVADIAATAKPRTVLTDVVVNPNFKSEGPQWQPDGQRIWCFSHAHRQQEYYPLVGVSVGAGGTVVVDYPKRCTSPNDLAVNPATEVPEFAFVAHVAGPQDVFIMLLNHY